MPEVFPTVVHMLADAVVNAPDSEALVLGEDRLTYREYFRSGDVDAMHLVGGLAGVRYLRACKVVVARVDPVGDVA